MQHIIIKYITAINHQYDYRTMLKVKGMLCKNETSALIMFVYKNEYLINEMTNNWRIVYATFQRQYNTL